MSELRKSEKGDIVIPVAGADIDMQGLNHWLGGWHAKNVKWRRSWHGGEQPTIEEHHWGADFKAAPIVETDRDGTFIRLTLTPQATYWRDWVAKLLDDCRAQFPGLSFDIAKVELPAIGS